LKHHARAAFVRGQAGHILVIEPDFSLVRRVEAGDVVEVRGALTLYMDFINLFINLLVLFGDKKE
jgi:FtsH-binding integral membrane protein